MLFPIRFELEAQIFSGLLKVSLVFEAKRYLAAFPIFQFLQSIVIPNQILKMHFPSFLSTLTAVISLPVSISAQDGIYGFRVSDCDGVTNVATYFASAKNIDNPVCVPWPDGNFLNNERSSTATGFDCDMWVYADPNCQVDPILYPSGCYVNIGSFAILCSLRSGLTVQNVDL